MVQTLWYGTVGLTILRQPRTYPIDWEGVGGAYCFCAQQTHPNINEWEPGRGACGTARHAAVKQPNHIIQTYVETRLTQTYPAPIKKSARSAAEKLCAHRSTARHIAVSSPLLSSPPLSSASLSSLHPSTRLVPYAAIFTMTFQLYDKGTLSPSYSSMARRYTSPSAALGSED